MRDVYIVEGSTGIGDDYQEWVVTCYLDRAQADIHVRRLKEECVRLKVDPTSSKSRYTNWNLWQSRCNEAAMWIKNTLDPTLDSIWGNGLSYSVVEAVLTDHFDQFQEKYNHEMIREA